MQDEQEQETQKNPREMTSDELLDYVIAPEVAERLKSRVRDDPPDDCDSDDD